MSQLLRIQEEREKVEAEEKRPKGKTWYLAIGFLVVIPLLLVASMAYSKLTQPTAADPTSAAPAQFVGTPQVKDLNQIVPTDTVWSLNGTTAVPSSKEAGPVSTNKIASGFARSPAGALFSLAWFSAEVWNQNISRTTLISQRVINTTGFEGLLQAYQASPADPEAAGSVVYQVTAYRLLSYTPDSATFVLVQRSTSAQSAGFLTAITYTVRWDGDWLIVPPPDGQFFPVLSLQTMSSQYKPFQGA